MREVYRSARGAEVRAPRRVAVVLGREVWVASLFLQAAESGAGAEGTVTRKSEAGSSLAACR